MSVSLIVRRPASGELLFVRQISMLSGWIISTGGGVY